MTTNVSLSSIESISRSDLRDSRLKMLENGHSSFDEVVKSRSDPITLDGSSTPYQVIDGRHRIFLARKKGYTSVPANIQ